MGLNFPGQHSPERPHFPVHTSNRMPGLRNQNTSTKSFSVPVWRHTQHDLNLTDRKQPQRIERGRAAPLEPAMRQKVIRRTRRSQKEETR